MAGGTGSRDAASEPNRRDDKDEGRLRQDVDGRPSGVGAGTRRDDGRGHGRGRRLTKREAECERARNALVVAVATLGQPRELGELLAGMLGTPKAMDRLTHYLLQVRPAAPEPMVDEALAIMHDRKTWQERKISENASAAYTRFVNLPRDEDGNVL